MCITLALAAAVALAGCGKTTYFAGRNLPPSGLTNRVLIAIQNPSALSKGLLQFVDAYYDIRSGYTDSPASFSISGYQGALPITIQNMPEEQIGAVYGSGDGSFDVINYATERLGGAIAGLNGQSSGIFITRSQSYVFAASQSANALTVVNQVGGGSFALSLPGVYRVSTNPGGSVALAFVHRTPTTAVLSRATYLRPDHCLLRRAQHLAQGRGGLRAAERAEVVPLSGAKPRQHPTQRANYYGAPLTFDRPVKAVFSVDGGTAYILSCGPECGGSVASVTPLPIAPMIFLIGQQSGTLPTTSALTSAVIPVPGGASNALVDSSTLYVVGQQYFASSGLFGGNLTVLDFSQSPVAVSSPISISDGVPQRPAACYWPTTTRSGSR